MVVKRKRVDDSKRMVKRYRPQFMGRPSLARRITYNVGSKEMKFNDLEITSPAAVGLFSAVTSATPINLIAQGTDYNQRIGRIINLQSLEFSYDIRCDYAANAYTTTKIVLFYDKQTNGSSPVYSDVYYNTSIHSRKNVNNEDRFQILHEEVIGQQMGESGSLPQSTWNAIVRRKGYIRLNGMKTMFSGTTAITANLDSGGLFLVAVNDNNAHSFIQGVFRVRYYD